MYIESLSDEQVRKLEQLCKQWAALVKDKDFKELLGEDYVGSSLKEHYLEVHIPEFAKQFYLTGSMSESGLELTHHDVKTALVNPKNWIKDQFFKNTLATSDILLLLFL